MKITFDTQNTKEVQEVLAFLLGTAHSVTETATEAPQKEKVAPSIPKEEKAVEAPVEKKAPAKKPAPKKETAPTVTLEALKDVAKNATLRTTREEVKACIGKYGAKLSEVKKEDYPALFSSIEALGK